jgi:hypothetical protein
MTLALMRRFEVARTVMSLSCRVGNRPLRLQVEAMLPPHLIFWLSALAGGPVRVLGVGRQRVGDVLCACARGSGLA